MNAITKHSNSLPTGGPPAPAGREFDVKLAEISNRVGFVRGVPKLIDCEIGPKTRGELTARLEVLDASLAHRNDGLLRDALLGMFAVTKLSGAENADDLSYVYAAHLGNLPTWAVVEACRQIARGRGESATFAPAAPEIYLRVESILAPLWRERTKITSILEASPEPSMRFVSEDEAERRKAHVQEAVARFAGKATA